MRKNFDKKIGFFSDIHIGLGQNSSVWHENILKFADWVSDFYTKENIQEIIIPGDIFHNRNEISVNTLNVAHEFFKKLKNFNIYISTGNHDCYYKDRSDVNSISLFSEWSNITVIDKVPEIYYSKNNKKICMVPWGTNIEDIPNSDICFGHFEISSFKMNNNHLCEHGISSESLLRRSPFIISGHFHTRTHRHYSNGQILYAGSPYQQNFGDIGSARGIYVLNLENNEVDFIENDISPKHFKIKLSELQNKTINSDYLKKIIPNNMISFVVDDNLSADKISLLSAKIQNLNPKFFRTEFQNPDTENNQIKSDLVCDSVDIVENMKDFINSIELNHKEEVIDLLSELYNKLAS